MTGTGKSITRRQLMEQDLRQSHALLREIEHLARLGSWNFDMAMNSITWSDELYRIFGLKPLLDITYDVFLERVHPDDRHFIQNSVEKALQDKAPYQHDYRIICPDGTLRIIHSRAAVVLDDGGQPIRMFGTAQDVTEQRQGEEERTRLFDQVRTGQQQLRNLSRRLLEIQETERRHLAYELHDEIGQALTAVQINLQTLQYLPEAMPLASRLEESIGLVERALHQVRDLSLDLRPSLLDDFGLATALSWYVERLAQRSGIPTQFVADPAETRLPPHVEIACFRVAQEALTNVVRHAQAQHVRVELRRSGETMQLLIHDDGAGFNVDHALGAAGGGASLGLLGMQERVHLASGTIEIQSVPGTGTQIRVSFPVKAAQPRERRTKRRRQPP